MPFHDALATCLALYACGCAAAAFFVADPSALLASGVLLPLAAAWLVATVSGSVA